MFDDLHTDPNYTQFVEDFQKSHAFEDKIKSAEALLNATQPANTKDDENIVLSSNDLSGKEDLNLLTYTITILNCDIILYYPNFSVVYDNFHADQNYTQFGEDLLQSHAFEDKIKSAEALLNNIQPESIKDDENMVLSSDDLSGKGDLNLISLWYFLFLLCPFDALTS